MKVSLLVCAAGGAAAVWGVAGAGTARGDVLWETQVRYLVNGVPTAVHDLTSLLDDPDNTLAKNYEKLPRSLKKLVTQLPEKLSSTPFTRTRSSRHSDMLQVFTPSQRCRARLRNDPSGSRSSGIQRLMPPRIRAFSHCQRR